jgi:hypothetical protein
LSKQHLRKIKTANKVLEAIRKSRVKWIRLQFCNPFGLLHQLSVPSEEITKESFVKGFPLDGSSILGIQPPLIFCLIILIRFTAMKIRKIDTRQKLEEC